MLMGIRILSTEMDRSPLFFAQSVGQYSAGHDWVRSGAKVMSHPCSE